MYENFRPRRALAATTDSISLFFSFRRPPGSFSLTCNILFLFSSHSARTLYLLLLFFLLWRGYAKQSQTRQDGKWDTLATVPGLGCLGSYEGKMYQKSGGVEPAQREQIHDL